MGVHRKAFWLLFVLLAPMLWAQAPGAADPSQHDKEAEEKLVRLVNREREKAGLASLELDDKLTGAARDHSRRMAEEGLLDHQLAGEPIVERRLAALDLRFDSAGENVARDDDPESAHAGLMASPGHRSNILNPEYNAIGIGVVRKDGKLWVTQDFAHRLESHTAEEAEDIIARELERLRRESKHPLLRREPLPRLQELACKMARDGALKTNPALGLPDVRYVVAYTETRPQRLPENTVKTQSDVPVEHFAVGACFAKSQKYPAGIYWVLLVFY